MHRTGHRFAGGAKEGIDWVSCLLLGCFHIIIRGSEEFVHTYLIIRQLHTGEEGKMLKFAYS